MTSPVTGAAAKKAAQLAKFRASGSSRVPRGMRRQRKAAAAASAPAETVVPVTPPTPKTPETKTNSDSSGAAGGSTKTPKPSKTAPAGEPRSSMEVPQPVSAGAGFILALMFWTWIALPFLNNGGVTGVRAQLKAKFTNKAPDGSWLP